MSRWRVAGEEFMVFRAADARTVRDEASARQVARAALGDEGDEAQVQALADALLRGELLVFQTRSSPRLLDAPDIVPLASLLENDESPEEDTTWISIEVAHEWGHSLQGLELELAPESGRSIYGRLDADGRFRADGIARGSWELRLLNAALGDRSRVVSGSRQTPDPKATIVIGNESVRLRAGAHHVVFVRALRRFCFSA